VICRRTGLYGAFCLAFIGTTAHAQGPESNAAVRAEGSDSSTAASESSPATGAEHDEVEEAVPRGSTLKIDWQGPKECGAPSDLEDETRRLLGAFADTAGVAVLGGAKQLSDGRYRIELHLRGAVSAWLPSTLFYFRYIRSNILTRHSRNQVRNTKILPILHKNGQQRD
jgi:hypothetical protein